MNERILRKLLSSEESDNDEGEFLFEKLRKHPHLRKSLCAVNNARAFRYGSRAFGKKKWYKENFDVREGLRSNEDRRKFRFGLKSNIDFLIQLDVLNLKATLQDTSFTPHTSTQFQSLSDGSFLSVMRNLDAKRCKSFCTILDRVADNLDFTQSLGEYFATDDMLEPALMQITEALRRDPNLRKNLHGGSFASNAMVYRHRASPRDHDRNFSRGSRPRSSPRTSTDTKSQKSGTTNKLWMGKFKYGYCFRFQHTDDCDRPECEFLHKCSGCDESSHGLNSCPSK